MSRNQERSLLTLWIALLALPGLLAACAGKANLLPHSFYFLSGSQGNYQVWRLEADGTTTTQLTNEQFSVDRFSVSQEDGSLAFISNNQLILVDGDGHNRRLVADGTKAPADPFRGVVSSPAFSPDSRTLAYAFDGLHLYDIASGKDEHVLPNLGNLLGETFVFEKEAYYPGSWSPDGSKLLIIMGYFEGSTLAVMEAGQTEPFRRLRSRGPVCCTYHWTPDGNSVLVANPSFGDHTPGLWRYDARSGEETELVASLPSQPKYVGWPVQLPSGDLRFFYSEQFTFEEGIPLVLVQSDPDGQDWTPVRPEKFHPADALWAEDGSVLLIRTYTGEYGSADRSAQIVLVRMDESPLQVLLEAENIQQMEWGP